MGKEKKYFVGTHEKHKFGPFSKSTILDHLNTGQISLTDMVVVEGSNDWMMVMIHPDFISDEPSASTPTSSNHSSDSGHEAHKSVGFVSHSLSEHALDTKPRGLSEELDLQVPFDDKFSKSLSQVAVSEVFDKEKPWYTQKEGKSEGPYTFLDILGKLQNGSLKEFDLVKKGPAGPFKKLAQFEDFQPESIQEMRGTQLGAGLENTSFFRRTSERKSVGKVFIVHDGEKTSKALCIEMSETGLGLLGKDLLAEVGDRVYIRFSQELIDNKFDATAEVKSSRSVRVSGYTEKFKRLGLAFEKISQNGHKELARLLKSS